MSSPSITQPHTTSAPCSLPGVRVATESEKRGYPADLGPWVWNSSWPWHSVCAGIAADVDPETVEAALWPPGEDWPACSQIEWLQSQGFTQADLPASPLEASTDATASARLSYLEPHRRAYVFLWTPDPSPSGRLMQKLGYLWVAAWDGERVVVADPLMQDNGHGHRSQWGDGWRLQLALLAPKPTG